MSTVLARASRRPIDTGVFARRFAAFGWHTLEIDGHNMAAIVAALRAAHDRGPTAIIARTLKGKGVSFLEDVGGWHGKPLDRKQMEAALAELGETDIKPRIEPRRIGQFSRPRRRPALRRIKVEYRAGDNVATRQAFGRALEKLGALNP